MLRIANSFLIDDSKEISAFLSQIVSFILRLFICTLSSNATQTETVFIYSYMNSQRRSNLCALQLGGHYPCHLLISNGQNLTMINPVQLMLSANFPKRSRTVMKISKQVKHWPLYGGFKSNLNRDMGSASKSQSVILLI